MDTIEHLTIASNGINLHVALQGRGPLVVLCHGNPGLWFTWRHQLPALAAAGYRAAAIDMRGYGRSDRPPAADIEVPCLFISGEQDPVLQIIDPQALQIMKQRCSDLRGVEIIEEAGHFVQQEQPEKTNEAILNFLSGL